VARQKFFHSPLVGHKLRNPALSLEQRTNYSTGSCVPSCPATGTKRLANWGDHPTPFCEELTAWHFAPKVRSCETREDLNVEPKREINVTMFRPRDHYTPGKVGEASPVSYNHGKAAQDYEPTEDQVEEWLHLWPGLFLSWCGASKNIRGCWEMSGILRPPIGLSPHRDPPERKSECKTWVT